ncbi:O-antigen ligase-like membrane protein [Lutibacter sp. Hel_I_33_5]|uniref:O-antigen ligase family protein n=1 Tax=Lutibacter sp. Hel_I_33_5 TaxID=1566289 RepID=UPI0011A78433|nr:O-antigen ligase family protein [Lutibacter sp. Hel_I_33_5]TVZ54870.1 O-antigen ligase-like membrane protein [Lutibacter sp. Hel_I_33_5]
MLNFISENKFIVIIIHILIGYLAIFSFFSKFIIIIIIIIGILLIIINKNKNEEALVLSGYIVGSEVFFRMTQGFILYETGKYAVILFLLLGLILGIVKQKIAIPFFIYLFLLIIGIVFTKVPEGESLRKAILFNLSGPLMLGICAIYCYKRVITNKEIINVLFYMLLPIFSTVAYLFFRTPDIKEIVFGGAANFETSGGFGPNQVATILGVGIFILSIFILKKIKISGYVIFDGILLLYFVYRGLLTFSRGGIITAVIALLFFSFFYILYQKRSLHLFFKYVIVGSFITLSIWIYTSNITNGMLDNRYSGKNARGVQKKDISSGRVKLIEEQFSSFMESPLFGLGVGNGKFEREKNTEKITSASHNEITRLIEEHGMIGIIILFILFFFPIKILYNSNNYQKAFLLSFFLFWFLTISHSGMRIAFPGFIYGLSLIYIKHEKN